MTPVRSMCQLFHLAQEDERYQRLCIVALVDLGCDHLANRPSWRKSPKWKAYYHGLNQYINSLIEEYGEDEGTAEFQVVETINSVRDHIAQAQLNWS